MLLKVVFIPTYNKKFIYFLLLRRSVSSFTFPVPVKVINETDVFTS